MLKVKIAKAYLTLLVVAAVSGWEWTVWTCAPIYLAAVFHIGLAVLVGVVWSIFVLGEAGEPRRQEKLKAQLLHAEQEVPTGWYDA